MTARDRSLTWIPCPVDQTAVDLLARTGEVALGYGEDARSWAEVAPRVTGVLLRTAGFSATDVAEAPHLRVIARHGVGYDSVDIEAASRRGIPVTITADANSRSVAEHAFALLLSVARKVPQADSAVRSGNWSTARADLTGQELDGRRLGLLGFGRIARRVAQIASAFDMEVLAADPQVSQSEALRAGVTIMSPEELFASSEVLSLHAPLLPSTRQVVDARTLAVMPQGAILINTARGGLVDPDALLAALDSGHLAGAGLDVLPEEPPFPGDTLVAHDRVVVTPHIGGQTDQAMRRVAIEAATAILDAYADKPLRDVVNGGALVSA
ncbi:hydroxyacid dehydrogenase [Nocardioides sp. NPDC057577]|uniref:hydroxyacid dehydrogenase n=1 Tax=Nocardioides sp. NPDC057577 TaxID=3346171 RepID=UPI00366D157F